MSHIASVLVDDPNVYVYDSDGDFEGTAYWLSASLARGKSRNAEYTISEVYVEYEIPTTISNFTFSIKASGDGGASFTTESRTLGAATSGVETISEVFTVSGEDPRIRLEGFKKGFFVRGLRVKIIERERV